MTGHDVPTDEHALAEWRDEVVAEVRGNILPFWARYAPDPRGGFHGFVGRDGTPDLAAGKALVTTARILWAFAAAYRVLGDAGYRAVAERALGELRTRFADPVNGGFWWALDAAGRPADTRKQVYGQAFVVYALAEWSRATGDTQALATAEELFGVLERHARDERHGGYVDVLDEAWGPMSGALSERDLEVPKSMNTTLHVLEAYTTLLRVRPTPAVRAALRHALVVMLDHVADPATGHLHLYFETDWTVVGHEYSPGHDVEASWLLVEAAEALDDSALLARAREAALRLAEATLADGLADDGGVIGEASLDGTVTDPVTQWWMQAEAVVGFWNAHQLTGEARWARAAVDAWRFVTEHFVDREHGEWFWGVTRDLEAVGAQKISAWKCPYHNARACLEIAERTAPRG